VCRLRHDAGVSTDNSPEPSECLCCRIVAGEMPADVVQRTERSIAFRDVAPQAPTHILVVPTEHHTDLAAAVRADPPLVSELVTAAADVADSEGIAGYRVVTNTGAEAGQSVWHLHLHVLGGRTMQWPPG